MFIIRTLRACMVNYWGDHTSRAPLPSLHYSLVIDGVPSMLTWSFFVFPAEEAMFANAGGESFSRTALSTAEQDWSQGPHQYQKG